MGRIIGELERIYGVKNGGDRKSELPMANVITQKDIANQLGLSVDALHRYKKLTTLIPELQDMLEEDELSVSVASRVLARLSKEEQNKIFEDLGEEQLKFVFW